MKKGKWNLFEKKQKKKKTNNKRKNQEKKEKERKRKKKNQKKKKNETKKKRKKTRKKKSMKQKVLNGFSCQYNGWKYIYIEGKNSYDRGFAYGQLCVKDFIQIQTMLSFFMFESYGKDWKEFFVPTINADFYSLTKSQFPELFDEMKGIADGLKSKGCQTSLQEILAWNFYLSIPYWFPSVTEDEKKKKKKNSSPHAIEGGNGARDKCSAFIAVGDWTSDGKIVVAHNSFSDFMDGQYAYIVLDIQPPVGKGHRMLMQTCPCWIWSGTDFFITSKGIIGTETTIGGFLLYEKKIPIGYRIREAMQYGNSLDDYVSILLKGNSGDYANSWLFGDIHENEILRIELGLKYHNVERTKNGFFIGFNATYDPRIRNLECVNQGFYDIRRHQGARYVRLSDLMDTYKGKINISIAQKIIADHYDVYLEKENKSSRTVCSHYELDAREFMSAPGRPLPFALHGALDGFVCDSTLAKNMQMIGRYGNSCGTPFFKDIFFKEHRQYERFRPYIFDRPSQPWTTFPPNNNNNNNNNKNKNKNKNKNNMQTGRRRQTMKKKKKTKQF